MSELSNERAMRLVGSRGLWTFVDKMVAFTMMYRSCDHVFGMCHYDIWWLELGLAIVGIRFIVMKV